jgi:DNA-binding MarR family transcriptional regulator
LVSDGIVAYASADAGDRRRKAIALTAKGRRLLKSVIPDIFQQMTDLTAPLSANERSTLLRLLTKVEAVLACVSPPAEEK